MNSLRRHWSLDRRAGLLVGVVAMAVGVGACGESPDGGPSGSGVRPPGVTSSGPGGTSSPSAASRDLASASPQAQPVDCPAGVSLPLGVDPRACGPVPADAEEFAPASDGSDFVYFGSFVAVDRNIGCDLIDNPDYDGTAVNCTIVEYNFIVPTVSEECRGTGAPWAGQNVWLGLDASLGECRGDALGASVGLANQNPGRRADDSVVLGDGEVLHQGAIACLSGQDGMTCWNGITGHGFRLSQESQLTW